MGEETRWIQFDPTADSLPDKVRWVAGRTWKVETNDGLVVVKPGEWLVYEPDGSVRVSNTGPDGEVGAG